MNRKDHLGKYYQKNGRFQEKRDKNSIGFCVISNYREDVVISLTEKEISFEEAMKAKNLPDPIILLYALYTYGNMLNTDLTKCKSYWTITNYGCVYSGFGSIVDYCNRDNSDSGIGVFSIDYYPYNRIKSYLCRLYREMWRIEK